MLRNPGGYIIVSLISKCLWRPAIISARTLLLDRSAAAAWEKCIGLMIRDSAAMLP
jgi:hypothetical protein